MSYNNIIPAWMFGEFNKLFTSMENKEITLKEFYNGISVLPDVPEIVKQNWKEFSEDQDYIEDNNV